MSADVIQFFRRPKSDQEHTDFPTIAFRSVVLDLARDHVDMATCEHVAPEGGDA
jgi:hypothetical protein